MSAFAVLFVTDFSGASRVHERLDMVWRIFPAVAVVFFTGVLDHIRSLKPWKKLSGQFLAAGMAWWGGVHITGIDGIPFDPWLSFFVTVFWLIGCANALNLIDGLDGLAAGIGFFATVTCFIAALLQGNYLLVAATAPLAGALLGFLRYNFNPATIFLGDSGSLTVGFLLGCFGVLWSQKSATILGMTAPLMALAIPLVDTSLSIARRYLRGQPIFTADRGHIHHRRLERGLSVRDATLLLYGVCFVGAIFSLLLTSFTQNQARALSSCSSRPPCGWGSIYWDIPNSAKPGAWFSGAFSAVFSKPSCASASWRAISPGPARPMSSRSLIREPPQRGRSGGLLGRERPARRHELRAVLPPLR